MIVISGALVLVALVLLVAGLIGGTLVLVYASIGVSIVSALALAAGVLQRRGEPAVAADGVGDLESTRIIAPAKPADRDLAAASSPAAAAPAAAVAVSEQAEPEDDEELEYGGTVFIVDGRPRYHVEGCRYLANKESEALDVLDAREEGFTPCGVCRPDEALEQALLEEEASAAELEDELEDELEETLLIEGIDEVDEDEDDLAEVVPAASPAETTAPVTVTAAVDKARTKAPTKAAAAKKAAAKAAPAKAPAATKVAAAAKEPVVAPLAVPAPTAPVTTPTKAVRSKKVAAKAVPAQAAPVQAAPAKAVGSKKVAAATVTPPKAAPAARGQVVIIPDRDKFHRADCRYVRDAGDAQLVTKAAASRGGFSACGLCKP